MGQVLQTRRMIDFENKKNSLQNKQKAIITLNITIFILPQNIYNINLFNLQH